jgi:hypothetical protein
MLHPAASIRASNESTRRLQLTKVVGNLAVEFSVIWLIVIIMI